MEKIVTVSQVNTMIKDLIDGHQELTGIHVQGELSNYKVYQSGHHYFSMKDSTGVLKCVMFRGAASQLKFQPQNGMEVVALGRISVFVRDGAYQLYVERLIPSGAGALNIEFERIKKELADEGLFDMEHKKPIPVFPRCIGVVTSGSGAAFHDILRVTSSRWPMAEIRILPVQVQGANAGLGIARAIEYADRWNLADVLIVGRGGGSMEDLWCFNDPRVARAIYNANTPIISAVGHEPDVTIADFVADVRAATPSNGAELSVPDRRDIIRHVNQLRHKMDSVINQLITNERARIKVATPPSPMLTIRERQMELDRLESIMTGTINRSIVDYKLKLSDIAKRPELSNPLQYVTEARASLDALFNLNVAGSMRAEVDRRRSNLIKTGQVLYHGNPAVRVQESIAQTDELMRRISFAMDSSIARHKRDLGVIRLTPPSAAREKLVVTTSKRALDSAMSNSVARSKDALNTVGIQLSALNPLKPLELGFAYAYHEDGTAITSVADARAGDTIHVKVADGTINCEVI